MINIIILDTVIVTSEKLKDIKDKDKLYSMKLKDYVEKFIELKIVKEDDTFIKFLYKVIGFKNEKQFVKFCEAAFKLMDSEN